MGAPPALASGLTCYVARFLGRGPGARRTLPVRPLAGGGQALPPAPSRALLGSIVGPAEPPLARHAAWMASVTNINEVLEGHVALELEGVDRLYLNAYVPRLQVAGQVVQFLCGHLGNPIP